jgi:pimeloyl-ACP methyl ester carboxylesterase
MIPAANALSKNYGRLQMPVAILTGAEDQLVEMEQSVRLHQDMRQSTLQVVPRTGHMVHQTALKEIMRVIDKLGSRAGDPER